MKYDGSSWVLVGVDGFSAGDAQFTTIAIDGTGTPYVAYGDIAHGGKITVMKYSGGVWAAVGTPGFSTGEAGNTSIVIGPGDTLYVAYQDYGTSYKACVKKFDGTSWVDVGSPGFSPSTAASVVVAINSSGTPYVAYADGVGAQVSVMAYSGGAWAYVGSPDFTDSSSNYVSLALDVSGTPYVYYTDQSTAVQKGTVMKYDGTNWVTVGSAAFTPVSAQYAGLAINPASAPCVVFSNFDSGYKAGMMVFTAGLAPVTGADTMCMGMTYTLSDFTTGGTWSSANTAVATVGSSGTVTPVATGTTDIYYTAGTMSVISPVTVDPPLNPGVITGNYILCDFGMPYTDTVAGGVWGLTDTFIAHINDSGIARAIFVGSFDTITYTITEACGSATAVFPVATEPCEGKVNIVVNDQILTLYPNPATTELTISATENISGVVITDLLGRTVYNWQFAVGSLQVNVDVAELPKGVYMVKINGEVRKFVKE